MVKSDNAAYLNKPELPGDEDDHDNLLALLLFLEPLRRTTSGVFDGVLAAIHNAIINSNINNNDMDSQHATR